MPFIVYIIYSKDINQYYIGQTENLEDRLMRHKGGYSKSTQKASDWALCYTEEFSTRSEAVQREAYIKSRKSRRYIENLIRSVG